MTPRHSQNPRLATRVVQAAVCMLICILLLFAASWFHLFRAVSNGGGDAGKRNAHDDSAVAPAPDPGTRDSIVSALGQGRVIKPVPPLQQQQQRYADGDAMREGEDGEEPDNAGRILSIDPMLEQQLERMMKQRDTRAEHDLSRHRDVFDKVMKQSHPDIELFVIWHDALGRASKILQDIRSHFVILAIEYFDWTAPSASAGGADVNSHRRRHDFETNLWRLYSGKGGWHRKQMARKVKQCGFGPFIAIVVLDPSPDYRDEQTAHGVDHVNHNINEAKKKYRTWSGGGFRVHGTFGPREAEHDIPLLFHVPRGDFAELLHRRASSPDNYVWAALGPVADADGGAAATTKEPRLTLVDRFVEHLLLFKSSVGSGSAGAARALPRLIYDAPLSVMREVHGTQLRLRSGKEPNPAHCADTSFVEDGAIAQKRIALPRDTFIQNEFMTTRETLGARGWHSCRDFLLALRSFDVKIGPALSVKSEDEHQSAMSSPFALDPFCSSCERWPETVAIWVKDDATHWAVASLMSAGSPIFTEQQKQQLHPEPREFDVPFFVDHGRKTITRRVIVLVQSSDGNKS